MMKFCFFWGGNLFRVRREGIGRAFALWELLVRSCCCRSQGIHMTKIYQVLRLRDLFPAHTTGDIALLLHLGVERQGRVAQLLALVATYFWVHHQGGIMVYPVPCLFVGVDPPAPGPEPGGLGFSYPVDPPVHNKGQRLPEICVECVGAPVTASSPSCCYYLRVVVVAGTSKR